MTKKKMKDKQTSVKQRKIIFKPKNKQKFIEGVVKRNPEI